MKKKTKSILIISLLLVFYSKCSLMNASVEYEYKDPIYNPAPSRNISLAFTKSDDHPDSFKDGMFIEGMKKTGFGTDGGFVFTKPKGPEIIKNAFITELKNLGFQVSEESKANIPEIQIRVNQFFMEPEVGLFFIDIISVIDINVHIIHKNKIYKRRFKSLGEVMNIQCYDILYPIALDRSLKNLTKKTLPEVVDLINQLQIENNPL
ncbi:YajG family lipoprotein [Leptospira levettii]|uniref:YajG family lipoprotein n=1 Tax=Leptospira levettii TaxID=2023178 RepID=A0AAW5VIU2_9LEPT|nr:YajG family lipoprotein [Leptospira levettii]MCW7467855.1 YajG family lipoprotein [Leptospira levettii]MCW7513423.1 YajG family lipoprotein [Leptospira levettii]MCW7517191.1 YajG family lipoprotein [Leptospira levettii]